MQILSTCLARDLRIYVLTAESLREHLPGCELHLATRKEDFQKFRNACGADVILWDESSLVPQMTLGDLKSADLPFPVRGAGWYFQQFLKYAFVNVSNSDEHFLIWDADTILLKSLSFLTRDGKAIYTESEEYHMPYFQTFEALFGHDAKREFSFISQHQIIQKSVLRQMLAEIESRFPSSRNWAWAILENLHGEGTNLFSEYETYGHYLKCRYPDSLQVRKLSWDRQGEKHAGYPPDPEKLGQLRASYDFLAFEAGSTPKRKLGRIIRRIIGS
jgi:hypothetical protein